MSTTFKEKQVGLLDKGIYPDLLPYQVPLGGWTISDDFHYFRGRMESYNGWRLMQPDSLGFEINYGYNFIENDGTNNLLVGIGDSLYRWNGLTFDLLTTGYTTPADIRWQSAELNNKLYLVNDADEIQVFSSGALTNLSAIPTDGGEPDYARFIVNMNGLLLVANTVEGGNRNRQRIRWSKRGDPSVWVSSDNNEANFYDFLEDNTEITGISLLSQHQLAVYQGRSINMLTYVGLPLIFKIRRFVVTQQEALFAPYSLVNVSGVDYYLGNTDFYAFDGSSKPQGLGINRVRESFWAGFRQNTPYRIFGFSHPVFPEIWWVYQHRDSSTFDRAIIYNYEDDCWTHRDYFPQSMLTTYLYQEADKPIADADNTIEEAALTFGQKRVGGTYQIIGGDQEGYLYIHGDTAFLPDEVSLTIGRLQTGDIEIGAKATRANRLHLTLSGLLSNLMVANYTGVFTPVRVTVLRRDAFDQGNQSVATTFVHPSWPNVDFRATAKSLSWMLETQNKISLGGYSYFIQRAGTR